MQRRRKAEGDGCNVGQREREREKNKKERKKKERMNGVEREWNLEGYVRETEQCGRRVGFRIKL